MGKTNYLILLFYFLFSIPCYSQYSISGYINTEKKSKTVYLSLLKYDEESSISIQQILFSTQTDSTGYFELKGKLLSDRNKLYRIHSNVNESDPDLQYIDKGKVRNFYNFIFSNSDSIYFPVKNQVWFSNPTSSNKADTEWRKFLIYERELLNGYSETKNNEATQQVRRSITKEIKLYSSKSINAPLVKLLAFSHIKALNPNLVEDYNKDPDFYSKLQNELVQQYGGTSYALQFQEEISRLSISSINTSYQFHKKLNYLLGALVLMLSLTVFVLFSKRRKENKREIINEVSALTNQENKIANLICEGLSNKEIASTLFISSSTVKTHIRNLYSKLEISNRQQLIEKLKNHP